jgi:diaminopimelate epimerase
VRFTKGHGTGNDFVVIADVDAELALTDADVAAITDRRFGIGADGILRVVPTAAVPEWAHLAGDAPWFMDYRNGDGSAVEMCGNGIRVFARYLHESGLVDAADTPIATRDGVKLVTRRSADIFAVDMGRPLVTGNGHTSIQVDGTPYDVACVSMGNPHAILAVHDVATAPVHSLGARIERLPEFPGGTNVEFIRVEDKASVTMRVWERGVGETLSCGTGACAVAVATAVRGETGREVAVHVPGGTLEIHWTEDDRVVMTGPAVLVADGELRPQWWSAARLSDTQV